MNYYDGFVLNIYSLILLLILLLSILFKREIYKYSSRLLRTIIIFIITLLVFEMLSWAFDGIDEQYAYVFNYTFNLLFFVTGMACIGFFASYVDYMNFGSKKRLRRRLYYMHIFAVAVVLAIINVFEPIIFSIDSANVYSRETYMPLGFILVYMLLIFLLIQTYRNRKNISSSITYSIYVFLILPFIGGIIQLFYFGLLIMWAGAGLGVVIAYIFTETISNSKDFLTKLYTRSITNDYMERLIEKDEIFGIIIIDIDSFKEINDTYGHKTGDRVLVHFSKLLINSFPKHSIISRFGGDEFVVIIKGVTNYQLNIYQELLFSNIAFYKEDKIMNKVRFSYGYAIRDNKSTLDIDNLLEEADKMMYDNKAVNKNYRRRVTDK